MWGLARGHAHAGLRWWGHAVVCLLWLTKGTDWGGTGACRGVWVGWLDKRLRWLDERGDRLLGGRWRELAHGGGGWRHWSWPWSSSWHRWSVLTCHGSVTGRNLSGLGLWHWQWLGRRSRSRRSWQAKWSRLSRLSNVVVCGSGPVLLCSGGCRSLHGLAGGDLHALLLGVDLLVVTGQVLEEGRSEVEVAAGGGEIDELEELGDELVAVDHEVAAEEAGQHGELLDELGEALGVGLVDGLVGGLEAVLHCLELLEPDGGDLVEGVGGEEEHKGVLSHVVVEQSLAELDEEGVAPGLVGGGLAVDGLDCVLPLLEVQVVDEVVDVVLLGGVHDAGERGLVGVLCEVDVLDDVPDGGVLGVEGDDERLEEHVVVEALGDRSVELAGDEVPGDALLGVAAELEGALWRERGLHLAEELCAVVNVLCCFLVVVAVEGERVLEELGLAVHGQLLEESPVVLVVLVEGARESHVDEWHEVLSPESIAEHLVGLHALDDRLGDGDAPAVGHDGDELAAEGPVGSRVGGAVPGRRLQAAHCRLLIVCGSTVVGGHIVPEVGLRLGAL